MKSRLTTSHVRRVLIVAGPDGAIAGFSELFRDATEVRVVKSVAEAAAALRGGSFDVVLCAAGEIIQIGQAAGEARSQSVLEAIGQGICVIDRDGKIVWANSRLLSYPPSVVETVRETASATGRSLFDDIRESGPRPAPRRSSFCVGRDFCFDMTVSVVGEADGAQMVALLHDLSNTRRLQDKINAIDAAGRELVGLDAAALADADPGQRLALIEEKIIRVGRDLLHFDHLVIRLLDPNTNQLDTVLACGLSEEAKNLVVFAEAENSGISGYVAATGRSYICPDVTKDRRYLPGLEGARSSLTVPLQLQDKVIGILNVESDAVGAFTEDDRQFAEIFARYIAMALHILKLLVVERSVSIVQIAADVDAETSKPISELTRDVTALIQDYGNDPGLSRRLRALLDEVDHVKEALHSVTEAPPVSGLVPPHADHDPALVGRRILIADDEDIIRETVADVLGKGGAITTMARDGNEALALIRSQPFDLILSDIKMPHKNGYEVFAAARAVRQDCPVILITGFGYDPNHAIVRASKEGLTGVLFKPFKVEQLLEEVRNALPAAGHGSTRVS